MVTIVCVQTGVGATPADRGQVRGETAGSVYGDCQAARLSDQHGERAAGRSQPHREPISQPLTTGITRDTTEFRTYSQMSASLTISYV